MIFGDELKKICLKTHCFSSVLQFAHKMPYHHQVCQQSVNNLSTVCHQTVTRLSSVCQQSVNSLSSVCQLSLASCSIHSGCFCITCYCWSNAILSLYRFQLLPFSFYGYGFAFSFQLKISRSVSRQ